MTPEGRISLEPIGVVRSAFSELAGMPLQSVATREVEGTIEILPALGPGMRDLEASRTSTCSPNARRSDERFAGG